MFYLAYNSVIQTDSEVEAIMMDTTMYLPVYAAYHGHFIDMLSSS